MRALREAEVQPWPEEELEDRIEAYLAGLLGLEETRAVERALATPAGATLLSQALALREVLATTPGEPPAGLLASLQASVAAELAAADQARGEAGAGQIALDSLRWSMSWLQPAGLALGGLRFALGARTREEPAPRKARPLWMRLLLRRKK
jgi:hypothetical protein